MKRIAYDLETNGLLYETDRVHCGTIYDLDTNKSYIYSDSKEFEVDGTIQDMLDILQQADLIVGHNIIKFDNMVLRKLYNVNLDRSKCIDTLIVSKLKYPSTEKLDARRRAMPSSLRYKHSLRAWGYRLKTMKDDYDGGWDSVNQSMLDYCKQDGVVTASIYNYFVDKGLPPAEAIRVEQEFAHIIARQEDYGVAFDVKAAQKLHIELEEEKERIEEEIRTVFKPLPIFTKKNELKNKYKKDGTPTNAYQKHLDNNYYYKTIDGKKVYGVDVITEFNPGSRQHIVYWLKTLYKWKPKELTEKGNVIVNEGVLKELEYPEAKLLAKYFNITKLLGQLALGPQAWLKQVKDDGRIHGQVDTLGAVTRRCTHNKPNMAQVPSPRAFKGKECRSLFKAGEGKVIVGCDASGLELRTLAHYMARYDKGAYAKTILEGDIHTENQKAAGLPTRDNAKTFIYGFLYGAGAAKLGEIVGGGYKEGDKLKKRFLRKLPAIKMLSEAVENTVKKTGTLRALDGNPYFIRSPHAALNVLLQGCGALVMKYWLIEYDRALREDLKLKEGIDYEFILNVHDEAQVECKEEYAETISKEALKAFETITKQLNFRIPLEGDARIGKNWYETH